MSTKPRRPQTTKPLKTKIYDTDPRVSDFRLFLDVVKAKAQVDVGALRGKNQANVSRCCGRVAQFFGGVELFDRGPYGARELTAAGKEIAEHVRQMLAFIDEARLRRTQVDLVRIGFTPVARAVVSAALSRIDDTLSGVPSIYQVREATAEVFLEHLANKQLEIAVGFDLGLDDDVQQKRIGMKPLISRPLELVIPSTVAARCPTSVADALQGLRRCYVRKAIKTPAPEPLPSYEAVTRWLQRCDVKVDRRSDVACATAGELFGLCATGKFFGLMPPITALGALDVQFLVAEGLQQKIAVRAYYRTDVEKHLRDLFPALIDACEELDKRHRPVHLRDLPKLFKSSKRR